MEAATLEDFVRTVVAGIDSGNVSLGGKGESPDSFLFSIDLNYAMTMFDKTLKLRLKKDGAYESIMDEVTKSGRIKVFHAF